MLVAPANRRNIAATRPVDLTFKAALRRCSRIVWLISSRTSSLPKDVPHSCMSSKSITDCPDSRPRETIISTHCARRLSDSRCSGAAAYARNASITRLKSARVRHCSNRNISAAKLRISLSSASSVRCSSSRKYRILGPYRANASGHSASKSLGNKAAADPLEGFQVEIRYPRFTNKTAAQVGDYPLVRKECSVSRIVSCHAGILHSYAAVAR